MTTQQRPDISSPTSDVRVDPVRWHDLATVAEIQRLSFRPGLAYGRFSLVALKLTPGVRFLVARTPDLKVVGCIIGDTHRGDARVMNIAVHPAARRQGVGALLLEAIAETIPDGDVVLMAEEPNLGAQALYEREGFERRGRTANYYGRGRHGVWMRKRRTTGSDKHIRV